MQEDIFPAAEKILSDIENVLKKDPNLISFEIIPAEDNENKSPVFHDEHSLGLASWSVQPLYCYAYNRLLDLRQNKHRREEPTTVSRWLLGTLLLNPDISTFWNMRRELVRSMRLDPLQELHFVSVVLHYKAKCFEAFSYRRWLLKFMLIENKTSEYDVETLLHNELCVATMSANRYANNCYAWSHREHIIETYKALARTGFNRLLENEWEESAKWCSRHVSDYSGFNYRQFLLKNLLVRQELSPDQKLFTEVFAKKREIVLDFSKIGTRGCNDVFLLHDGSCKEVVDLLHGIDSSKRVDTDYEQNLINLSFWAEDCILNEELITTFPGHEALWYHRRFLAYTLLVMLTSYRRYFCYKAEVFELHREIRAPIIEEIKSSKIAINTTAITDNSVGLLEVAFRNRNREMISSSKHYGNHQKYLADKFVNFLTCIGLVP